MAEEEVRHAIISRKEARRLGLKRYFNGRPCPRGHVAERYTSKSTCCVCVRETAERCNAARRKPPKPSVRAAAAKEGLTHYRGKPCRHGHNGLRFVRTGRCVHCMRAKQKEYSQKPEVRERRRRQERERYARHPQKHRDKVKHQYRKDGDRIRARRRAYHYEVYQDEEVRKAAQERTRKWALDHPERVRRNAKVSKHRRRAIERLAPGSFTADDVATILRAQKRRCAYCRKKLGLDYHVDHVIPLSRGGTNDRSNIQITCEPCNLAKGARDPILHARSLGMLL